MTDQEPNLDSPPAKRKPGRPKRVKTDDAAQGTTLEPPGEIIPAPPVATISSPPPATIAPLKRPTSFNGEFLPGWRMAPIQDWVNQNAMHLSAHDHRRLQSAINDLAAYTKGFGM